MITHDGISIALAPTIQRHPEPLMVLMILVTIVTLAALRVTYNIIATS